MKLEQWQHEDYADSVEAYDHSNSFVRVIADPILEDAESELDLLPVGDGPNYQDQQDQKEDALRDALSPANLRNWLGLLGFARVDAEDLLYLKFLFAVFH